MRARALHARPRRRLVGVSALLAAALVGVTLSGCSLDLERLRMASGVDAGVDASLTSDAGLDGGDAAIVDASADLGRDAARPDFGVCGASCGAMLFFGPPYSVGLPAIPVAVATGDVDGDLHPDVVVLAGDALHVLGTTMAGRCRTGPLAVRLSISTIPGAIGISVADLGGDGDDDVAVVSAERVAVHSGGSPPGGSPLSSAPLTALIAGGSGVVALESPPYVVVTSTSSDGRGLLRTFALEPPLLRVASSTITPTALANPVRVVLSTGGMGVAATGVNEIVVYAIDAFGTATQILDWSTRPASRLAGGDFNGDAQPDIAANWTGGTDLQFAVLGTVTIDPVAGIVSALAAGNFNDDGTTDLVAIIGSAALVYPVTGALVGTPVSLPMSGPNGIVTVADIDGDGLDDVVTAAAGSASGNVVTVYPGACRGRGI